MRARIVKRESDKVVLKINDKLLRVPKNKLDFDYKVGDYVVIEKIEDETFILPEDDDNAAIEERPQAVEITSKAKAAPKNRGGNAPQAPIIPAPKEIPDWIGKIKEKDRNYPIVLLCTGILAFIFIISLFSTIGSPEIVDKNQKSDTIIGIIILLVATLSIAIHAVITIIKINKYFRSEEFAKIKDKISKNTADVNELNHHIEELKNAATVNGQVNQGHSELTSGGYNFRRPGWNLLTEKNNVHQCGLQVVKNSKEQPFKYICKYFDMKPTEETLNTVEEVFNNYSAAEQGKESLIAERNDIIASIDSQIPDYIKKKAPNRFLEELGFEKIDFDTPYFPTYVFRYVSAGGNSIAINTITMDLDNLEGFIEYLGNQIKWRKSVAGQRSLMTTALREKIKERDDYTCKKCGISTKNEPHLLLEIDHIMPLAKGGMTTENNLQTLCWRCNRSKGTKTN